MKNGIFLIVFLLISTAVFPQFQYNFTSTPDSAEVKINGEVECHTPCQVKFFWRKLKKDQLNMMVEMPGYVSWCDSITEKPSQFDFEKHIELDRKLPVLDFDSSSAVVAFDRLLAEFKDGRKVGDFTDLKGNRETFKWEGSTKIGADDFRDRFYEILTNANFQTPISQHSSLFSGESEKRKRLPRYVVGVQLMDYKINLRETEEESFGAGNIVGKTSLELEWQVMDKVSDEVVLKYQNQGNARYRQRYSRSVADNMLAFEDALIDFINESDFYELVNNAETIKLSTTTVIAEESATELAPAILPEFANLSEMIKRADKSCVTVITDGGHGSGVIINSEGYMLSAYHVVEGVNKIEVQFSEGVTLDASILRFDRTNDLVLLDIAGSGFQPLPVAQNRETSLGEEVITIGAPAGLELGQSVAKGILSGKRMLEERVYLQGDIAVSPGNSGGPLLNSRGEILGIIQSKIIGSGVEGICFAIPIERSLELLNIKVAEE